MQGKRNSLATLKALFHKNYEEVSEQTDVDSFKSDYIVQVYDWEKEGGKGMEERGQVKKGCDKDLPMVQMEKWKYSFIEELE